MSNIYKFYHNTGKIENIYIFIGDLLYTQNISLNDIEKMYTSDRQNPVLEKVFDKTEIR